ncbi:hypothetical protein VTJ49DRAFT_4825 [Mycothermus thermophilus]|uniref:Defect at low temperature protein 1 n=1 Tax=Humicola insolens TaxID=85995 RepID=A0ABR3V4D2_HUMIN
MATLSSMSPAAILFLIVYNFFYYFLYLVLFAVLIVTPIDLIQQGVQNSRNYDILAIIVVYVVTILVVGFIYAARLYISRSVLASIPKQWVPVEKGDVPPAVRRMIVDSLSRSAAIAYEARPRNPLVVLVPETATPTTAAPPGTSAGAKRHASSQSGTYAPPTPATSKNRGTTPASTSNSNSGIKAMSLTQDRPFWANIEHPGWAPPTAHDLPNLQYDTVIAELPNLIEAKALTLAPPDPHAPQQRGQPPPIDPQAVALLTRPDCAGLREYLALLTDLGVLAPPLQEITADFLARYEAARFSGRPLTAAQFRELMALFSELLRGMQPLSRAMLATQADDGSSASVSVNVERMEESDIDEDAPRGSSPSSAGLGRNGEPTDRGGNGGGMGMNLNLNTNLARRPSHASTETSSSSGSVARPRPSGRGSSTATPWGGSSRHHQHRHRHQQYRTAPTTPRSVAQQGVEVQGSVESSSDSSFAHTRRPFPASEVGSYSDEEGSGSGMGGSDDAGGSVIRLPGSESD